MSLMCERSSGNCKNCCGCSNCGMCPYDIKGWRKHPTNDAFGIIFGKKIPCKIKECRYYDKPTVSKNRYVFGCINPRSDKLQFSVKNINKVIRWIPTWFNNTKYKEWFAWVETGKNPDNPSIHLHYIWAKNGITDTSNNKRNMTKSWESAKLGKCKNADDHSTEQFTEEYLKDKLMYAINATKDEHSNFRDLIGDPLEGQMTAYDGGNSLTAKFRELRNE